MGRTGIAVGLVAMLLGTEVSAQPVAVTPDEVAEQALDDGQRRAVQRALAWFGHYGAAVDGAFGRGTRAAMAEWQVAHGADATGILTPPQRMGLIAAYAVAQAQMAKAMGSGQPDAAPLTEEARRGMLDGLAPAP